MGIRVSIKYAPDASRLRMRIDYASPYKADDEVAGATAVHRFCYISVFLQDVQPQFRKADSW